MSGQLVRTDKIRLGVIWL